MNLLTDSLPAIAIGMEGADDKLLSEKPRNPKESILSKAFMTQLLVQGGLIAVCTMIAFYIGLQAEGAALASTMAFSTLTLARLFHGFNCRSEQSIFKIGLFTNQSSLGAFVAGVALLTLVIFVPFLSHLFEISALTGSQIGLIALLAFVPSALIQLFRVFKKSR